MRVDQAIYTSLPRAGRAGYHVVGRSRGVSDADARALASWSPSHGALIVDDANRVSLNIHPLTDGRLAVSRTCEGPPEYSGRGGRQIYTHALVLDRSRLERSGASPIDLYRDALALGIFRYRPFPETSLDEVELGRCHSPVGARGREAWEPDLRAADLECLRERLSAGDRVQLHHPGDRLRFAECMLRTLPDVLVAKLSVSTSLQLSSARPFHLSLIG